MHAIILAGGRGTRLTPHTDTKPKPLVQVHGRPVLEIIICQLRAAGFTRLTLCVSHFGEMIRDAIGDGGRYGIATDYCWDVNPLGTAAPLRHVERWESPALVMNADILTALDFAEMMKVHCQENSLMTVATRQHEVPIDFGVMTIKGNRVEDIEEKPRMAVDISAGIQVIEPVVRKYIPEQEPLDMPSLIWKVINGHHRVTAYRFSGPWHDIGSPESFRRAVHEFERSPERYIPASTSPRDPATHPMGARHA